MHEIDRMVRVLPEIARRAEELNVLVHVRATKRERHDVVEVILLSDINAANSAPASLED